MKNLDLDTVAMLITPRVSRMDMGEISDCEGLFDSELWNDVPPSERGYVYCHPIYILVDQGLVPLECVGFNSMRHNLYRKK